MNIKNALNNKITLLNALSSHQPTLTKNQIKKTAKMIWWSFLMAYNDLSLMLFYFQYVCWITQNTRMALNNNIVHPKKRN